MQSARPTPTPPPPLPINVTSNLRIARSTTADVVDPMPTGSYAAAYNLKQTREISTYVKFLDYFNSIAELPRLLSKCLQCVAPVNRLILPRFRRRDDVIVDHFRRRAAGARVQPAL